MDNHVDERSEMQVRGAPDSEFSEPFVEGMRDRMAVSFHKYGLVRDGFPERVDVVASAKGRLTMYEKTGNGEWLIDAANFLMIETMAPRHMGYHFRGTDADESIGRVTAEGVNVTKNTHLLTVAEVKEFGVGPGDGLEHMRDADATGVPA